MPKAQNFRALLLSFLFSFLFFALRHGYAFFFQNDLGSVIETLSILFSVNSYNDWQK